MRKTGFGEFDNSEVFEVRVYPGQIPMNSFPATIKRQQSFVTVQDLRIGCNSPHTDNGRPPSPFKANYELIPTALIADGAGFPATMKSDSLIFHLLRRSIEALEGSISTVSRA